MAMTYRTARVVRRAAVVAGGLMVAMPAMAQDAAVSIQALQSEIKKLQLQQQQQIQQLQAQLAKLQSDAAARDAALKQAQAAADQAQAKAQAAQNAVAAAPPAATPAATMAEVAPGAFVKNGRCGSKYAAPDPNAPSPTLCLGNVSITLGGFVDVTGFYRSRNESAGLTTSWAGIPFGNSPNAHIGELRESSQYSRFSMLVEGKPSATQTLSAYFEGDLNGSGVTSTTVQTNSYSPRVRQAFAEYDDSDWGLHITTGQAYSMVTPNAFGLVPRQEQLPLTLDSGYVPGFTYTRQPQVRVTKDFDNKYWLGLSLETPQTVWAYSSGGTGKAPAAATALPAGIGALSGASLDLTNAGSGGLNSTANYSIDAAPDVVVKAAADPGFGHYEVYGLGRVMQDRVSLAGRGENKTATGGGLGAAARVPVVPGVVDVTGNVLAGYGIGRYGAGQLPDATVGKNGAPVPLPEVEAMLGAIGHVTPDLDLFTYGGIEQIGRKYFTVGSTGYGYGSPLFDNSGCNVELSTVCPGSNINTSRLENVTLGGWYRVLHGGYGTFMAGAEYAYTKRKLFAGVGGAPATDENLVEVSLRYLPFQ